jgi:uncharacterized Zn-finger protein
LFKKLKKKEFIPGDRRNFFLYIIFVFLFRLHSKEVEPNYRCSVEGCNRGFYSRATLLCHQRGQSHQSSLTCSREGCGRRFPKPWLLRAHEAAHDGRRRFSCDAAAGCTAQFDTQSKLRRHQKVHERSPGHRCSVCGKLFTRPELLKSHLLTHQEERSYKCFCGKSFSLDSLLARHVRRVHEKGEERKESLICPHCDQR